MRLHFQAEQWLPYPVEDVFAFFANPANLPRLMPRWQHTRIDRAEVIAPPAPPGGSQIPPETAAGSGTQLTLTFRPLPYSPIRLSWDALIEDFRWNEGFCDVQLQGPFRYWRHCHSVYPARSPLDGSPGTRLRDAVHYELPFGASNTLGGRLIARQQFTALFRYRHRRTAELLAHTLGQGRSLPVSRFD